MEQNFVLDAEMRTRRLIEAWACLLLGLAGIIAIFLLNDLNAYENAALVLLVLAIRHLWFWLEAKVLRMELNTAEFFLYITLPRRQREPIVGDLDEDFTANVLPRFGPRLAGIWYWYKALLCISMYACENGIEPFIRRVVEPRWRRAILPLLKWTVAPVFVIHKLNWGDSLRTFIDKLR